MEKTKKKKVFSIGEFQSQLASDSKSAALENFLKLIQNNDSEQDCLLEYLEHNGKCVEFLKILQKDPTVSPVVIFEIINEILLKITAKYRQYSKRADEACYYLIHTYLTLINRMLSTESTTIERTVVLKLLTSVVTFSSTYAKDILMHVVFDHKNLSLITNPSRDNQQVRHAFIKLLVAFLICGHTKSVSLLLEKKGFVTCIVDGLKYDPVDIVELVLTAMKTHILKNGAVRKTVKLKTFTTLTIRQIVALFNWRGPNGYGNDKIDIDIDETLKVRINEIVYDFLLTLCTSYCYGVVFADHTIGLNRNQYLNQLMYTVLLSLDRPWKHSYVQDLTLKICEACPDLVRWQWTNLTKHLEPRETANWLNAMNFSELLLNELTPNCIKFAIKQLSTQQLSQIIKILILPLPVLKLLITQKNFKTSSIRIAITKLLRKMLESTNNYLNHIKQNWLHIDYFTVNSIITKHIQRYFPNALMILSNLENIVDTDDKIEHLEIVFDIVNYYDVLSPELLDCLNNNFDIKQFITNILKIDVDQTKLNHLLVKITKFLLNFNRDLFQLNNELFEIALTTNFHYYYHTHNQQSFNCLSLLFDNITIIKSNEIQIWIDGILNLKQYKPEIVQTLIHLLRKSSKNSKNPDIPSSILIIKNYLRKHEITINFKNYFLFIIFNLCHLHANYWQFCIKFDFIPPAIHQYFNNWSNGEITKFSVNKNFFEKFQQFSNQFFDNHFDTFIDNFDLTIYPNFKLNLLQMVVFYLNNLINSNLLDKQSLDNAKILIKAVFKDQIVDVDKYCTLIFKNSTFLNSLNIYKPADVFTGFFIDVVGILNDYQYDLSDYLIDFRSIIVGELKKFLKKPKDREINYEIFQNSWLSSNDCRKILSNIPDDSQSILSCYRLFIDCLNQLSTSQINVEPLSDTIIEKLCQFFVNFSNHPQLPELSVALLNYFQKFPNTIQAVQPVLIETILLLNDYNKDNLALCHLLLANNSDFFCIFQMNLDQICEKKGFILNLLDLVIKYREDLLEEIAKKLEPTLLKILMKPHKANQHFHNFYQPVGELIDRYIVVPNNFCNTIQRFQTTEIFHVYLINRVFHKFEKNPTILTNMILTFVYLEMNLFKQQFEQEKINRVSEIFYEFLIDNDIKSINNFTTINKNDSFNQFIKFCLKYGVSGEVVVLLKILQKFFVWLEDQNVELVFEMMTSHSKFLDVLLDVDNQHRQLILELWRDILDKRPTLMRKPHVPILLSAYSGTMSTTNRIILDLLKLYQSKSQETEFYTFKPFLWGTAAANHYSIHTYIDQALYHQPKMTDILNNLQESLVLTTIKNPNNPESYDLEFFLPLFNQLLAPESYVQIFKFAFSGALSLTIIGLSNDNYEIRLGACHVLSRYYHHLEARSKGEYYKLCLHFTEIVCKGTAILKGFKMNNFASVFLARMALILEKPLDKMYVPLTHYLLAKPVLDFHSIPELYTFLHYNKDCQRFILEVIRDGCRTNDDFIVFMKSMAFKLISELCSSSLCDTYTRKLIFDIFNNCCKLQLGWLVLNKKCSFSSQVYSLWHLIGDKFKLDNNDNNDVLMAACR